MSSKLHPYSLQRTQSSPGPRLPKRIRNTHPRNHYDLKGKDIDLHFLFQVVELYCELNYHNRKIRIPQYSSITEASPSDCLVPYPGHLLEESCIYAEKQLVYCIAPGRLGHRTLFFGGEGLTLLQRCSKRILQP